MKKLAFIGLSFLVASCGLNQDPLKSLNSKVKDSRPVTKPDQKVDPVASDALRIDSESIVTFTEGVAGHFEAHAKVFLSDYTASDLQIDNASEFPGMTYDAATGILTWTPEVGSVHEDFYTTKMLTLKLSATSINKNMPPLIASKNIQIIVNRTNYNAPKFTSASQDLKSISEGMSDEYCFAFSDDDSLDQNGKRPRVEIFQDSASDVNIAGYATVSSLDFSSSDRTWNACIQINLQNAELTKDVASSNLNFRIYSRFNKVSPDYHTEIKIYTQLGDVVSTFPDKTVVKPQVDNHISFLVYDPHFEGNVTLDSQSLPAGATVTCKPQQEMLACDFAWNPTADQANSSPDATVTFKSTNKKDSSRSHDTDLTLDIHVDELPTPTPTPTPNPTPSNPEVR
jgi:hypothetical protein